MNKPFFSVIIPAYNAELYIERAVLSLVEQYFSNIEIIVVNDGSTDSTLSKTNYLAQRDKRVTVIDKLNGGVSSARNVGINNANGSYLAFLDSDDWLESDAFSQLYGLIHEYDYPDIIMFNGYKNQDIKNKPFMEDGYYNREKIIEEIFPRSIESCDRLKKTLRGSNCLRIYHSSLIQGKVLFDESLNNNEDLLFNLEAVCKASSFVYAGELYIHHNMMTPDSISRSYIQNSNIFLYDLIKSLKQVLSKFAPSIYDFSNQVNMKVLKTLIFCIENEFHLGNTAGFIDKYKFIRKLVLDKELQGVLLKINVKQMDRNQRVYLCLLKNKMTLATLYLAKYRTSLRKG